MTIYRVFLPDTFISVQTDKGEERAKQLAAEYFRQSITSEDLIAWDSNVEGVAGPDVRES